MFWAWHICLCVPEPEKVKGKGEGKGRADHLFPKALDGFVFILSREGDIVYVNENVVKYLGIQQVGYCSCLLFLLLVLVSKDRIQNTIVRQGIRETDKAQYFANAKWKWSTICRQGISVTDIVEYFTKGKWKWEIHIAETGNSRWTIRSTVWQIKVIKSVGRSKGHWRHDMKE